MRLISVMTLIVRSMLISQVPVSNKNVEGTKNCRITSALRYFRNLRKQFPAVSIEKSLPAMYGIAAAGRFGLGLISKSVV